MDWIDLAQYKNQWQALVNTDNEPLVSINCSEVLERTHNHQLLKMGSAP
jgi:hypothetical protein